MIAVEWEEYYREIATVLVHRYFKDIGVAVVRISGLGPGSLCLSTVSVGQRLVFYTTGDPSTGRLEAHYLSQFDAVDPATPAVVAEVIATVGHAPALPFGYYSHLPLAIK